MSCQALEDFSDALRAEQPWLAAHLPTARSILKEVNSPSVADALNAARSHSDSTPFFVNHSELPADEAYETFIFRTGQVPTRDNLHDLFNGLIWLSHPKTKQRLNALQAEQLKLVGVAGSRGTLRDALTVFDENAAILQAPATLVEALRRRDWKTLFNEQRSLWRSANLVLFGHALLEKLMQPRKAITAHVWVTNELTDEALADSLDSVRLTAKDFLPLPVLGVPGWWPANENPDFYADSSVFRLPANALQLK
jgi:hypothetical protein